MGNLSTCFPKSDLSPRGRIYVDHDDGGRLWTILLLEIFTQLGQDLVCPLLQPHREDWTFNSTIGIVLANLFWLFPGGNVPIQVFFTAIWLAASPMLGLP